MGGADNLTNICHKVRQSIYLFRNVKRDSLSDAVERVGTCIQIGYILK